MDNKHTCIGMRARRGGSGSTAVMNASCRRLLLSDICEIDDVSQAIFDYRHPLPEQPEANVDSCMSASLVEGEVKRLIDACNRAAVLSLL